MDTQSEIRLINSAFTAIYLILLLLICLAIYDYIPIPIFNR